MRPYLVALLLDAYAEFDRAIAALPAPGRGGAIGRLNPGALTVAHVAAQQDRYFNVAARGIEDDPWLAEFSRRAAEGAFAPPFGEASEAWTRVSAGVRPYLEGLTDAGLESEVRQLEVWPWPPRVGELVARSIGHIFAHAGELAALGSLVGSPDLGLPGRLPNVTARALGGGSRS